MYKVLCALIAVTMVTSAAEASKCRSQQCCVSAAPCQTGCNPCATVVCRPKYKTVEQTVMVPQMVTEVRKVNCTAYRMETRQRDVTVCKRVPETKEITQNYTVYIPEQRTRKETYVVCKPVWQTSQKSYTVNVPYTEQRTGTRQVQKTFWKDVNQDYYVNVPYTEQRTATRQVQKVVMKNVKQDYCVNVPYTQNKQGTRTIMKCVPVKSYRTVCEDQGHWEERPVQSACPAPACGVLFALSESGFQRLFRRKWNTLPIDSSVSRFLLPMN
jgi:hypothetical protein